MVEEGRSVPKREGLVEAMMECIFLVQSYKLEIQTFLRDLLELL